MKLTTLMTFDNVIEAQIVKAKLESEHVSCYLSDEHIVGLIPLYNITVGGIKLKVRQADVERATGILGEASKVPYTDESDEIVQCPSCNSTDVWGGFKSMKGTKGILSAIISFLFMVYPIYIKTVYKCNVCGKEF